MKKRKGIEMKFLYAVIIAILLLFIALYMRQYFVERGYFQEGFHITELIKNKLGI